MSDIKIAFFDIDGTLIDMSKQYPSENTKRALIKLKEKNILICLATGRSPMTLPRLDGICVDAMLTYNGSYCFEAQHILFSNPIPQNDVKTIIENENIYQVMLGCRAEDYGRLMKNVQNAKITAWWNRAVDIIPLSSGKGLGIRKVLEYYHLDSSEAIAFGDGNNDMDMLRAVGVGIAMGNASEELKQMADGVCSSAAEDGIYHYCVENGLI